MAAPRPRARTPESLLPLVRAWGRLWGVPELADVVTVRFSPRMRRSLGRSRPATGEVRLAAFLCDGPRERLEEALCHEVAHVAAYHLRRGRYGPPHGADWRELVTRAGFEPRTRARAHPPDPPTSDAPPRGAPPGARQTPRRYEHRCPVCQTVRVAKRPVPQWHCDECIQAGLPGTMVITRLDTPGDGGP